MLKAGTLAPEFTSTLDDGSPFDLASFRGKNNVVLYFYPKDFTPGCIAEACSFRDNYDEVCQYDAVIFGVSADSEQSHTSFRERYELPFRLIADPERKAHRLYEVTGLLPWMTPRITYVIDKSGVIRVAIRHDLRVTAHVPDVIDALKAIQPAAGAS